MQQLALYCEAVLAAIVGTQLLLLPACGSRLRGHDPVRVPVVWGLVGIVAPLAVGPSRPRVQRRCQNKRYEAELTGTPEGERGQKVLQARKRRLAGRIARDQAELAAVLELGSLAAEGAEAQ